MQCSARASSLASFLPGARRNQGRGAADESDAQNWLRLREARALRAKISIDYTDPGADGNLLRGTIRPCSRRLACAAFQGWSCWPASWRSYRWDPTLRWAFSEMLYPSPSRTM